MVIYYSWKGRTKAYARELAALRKDTVFELIEKKKRSGILGFISGGFQSITKKESPVEKMPDLNNINEIYICSPVWASGITPAVRYFINHAALAGITVNFILTCANILKHEDYRKSALEALDGVQAKPGAVYVFAGAAGGETDTETVRSHINKVILGVE